MIEKIQRLKPAHRKAIETWVDAHLSPLYEEKDSYGIEDIELILSHFPADKKWTAEELEDEYIFPPDLTVKIELIDYSLHVMPDPTARHQEILGNIFAAIHQFMKKHKLGKVYPAPFSLHIDEGNVRKPDIVVVLSQKVDRVTARGIAEAPDLVVEVMSPANYKKLREEKKKAYADFGIREYWEIYPEEEKIQVSKLLAETGYQVFSVASPTADNTVAHSKILEGFSLSLEAVF